MDVTQNIHMMTIRIDVEDIASNSSCSLYTILPSLLQDYTRGPWRAVGANIIVECVEPYWTFILQPTLLHRWDTYCRKAGEVELSAFEFQIELHAPLACCA